VGLEQRQIQSQKLILSPQLRQYLKLLQLPLLELKQAVEQELAENPVLEELSPDNETELPLSSISREEIPDVEGEKTVELDFQNKLDALGQIDQDFKETLYSDTEPSEDETKEFAKKKAYQESIISKSPTLNDYLTWQLSFLDLDEEKTKIAQELIGNIDEDGYLKIDIQELSLSLGIAADTAEEVLKLVQTLDPPGVGGRDLREVLLIQLSKLNLSDSVAAKIVQDHFALLEKKHFSEIAKKLDISGETVKEAFQTISKLEPKPGRVFYANESIAMIPDATVYPDEDNPGEYRIEIHQESVPSLRVSTTYRKMLKDKKLDPAAKTFLRNKVSSALSLIQAISQRKNTLRAITEEILKAQHDFFDKGFAHLKPLRLKDIAEKIGIHESTVSRAVSGKYIVTPQGTIPYRSFFSNKMETEDGSLESQKSITERIKQLIAEENKQRPLSDAKIVRILSTDGIKIARRTVAKYRELLKILPTHLRKER